MKIPIIEDRLQIWLNWDTNHPSGHSINPRLVKDALDEIVRLKRRNEDLVDEILVLVGAIQYDFVQAQKELDKEEEEEWEVEKAWASTESIVEVSDNETA